MDKVIPQAADACMQIFEPVLELLVMLSIFDQRVRSVEDNDHALAVSEPFGEGT